MNTTSALSVIALAAVLATAQAIPPGINYQGVLTDSQGQPVTGTRTMSIKLYDAATSGTQLYTEDLGTVSVTDGVFSFEFGKGGTSNTERSDTVAITDGTATTFEKVLSASEVVAGSVSVTDGTYTWSQSRVPEPSPGGSSIGDEFGVDYSIGLRRVTVTYSKGAPAAGRTITVTYRTPTSGIVGALAGGSQPWAEITIDGVAQVPRQKVLTVPFAQQAGSALDIGGVTVAGITKGFGDRLINLSNDQVYQAPADGLIVATARGGGRGIAGELSVLVGGANESMEPRGFASYGPYEAECITIPVRSGEFYSVFRTNTGTGIGGITGGQPFGPIYYIPIEKWK